MGEKTGGTRINYGYDTLKVEEEGIIKYIDRGNLKFNDEVVQVPSKKSLSKIFSNERRVFYLATKKDLNEITLELEKKV